MFELKIIEPGVFKFDYIATQAGQSSAGMPENCCWGQVDRKKMLVQYLHNFWNVKKTWKIRNTVNTAVFWPLLDTETLVFTQFSARDGAKPL